MLHLCANSLFYSGWYSAGARKINLGQIATASGPHYAIKVKIYEAKEKKPNIWRSNIWTPLSLRTAPPLYYVTLFSRSISRPSRDVTTCFITAAIFTFFPTDHCEYFTTTFYKVVRDEMLEI